MGAGEVFWASLHLFIVLRAELNIWTFTCQKSLLEWSLPSFQLLRLAEWKYHVSQEGHRGGLSCWDTHLELIVNRSPGYCIFYKFGSDFDWVMLPPNLLEKDFPFSFKATYITCIKKKKNHLTSSYVISAPMCFETDSCYVAQAWHELTLNSWGSSCLGLPSAEITNVCYHTQLKFALFSCAKDWTQEGLAHARQARKPAFEKHLFYPGNGGARL